MTSNWLFLAFAGLVMSISSSRAGSLKQFEEYSVDDTVRDYSPLQHDDALEQGYLEALKQARREAVAYFEQMPRKASQQFSRHYGGSMSAEVKEACLEELIVEKALQKLREMGYTREKIASLYGVVLSDEAQAIIGCGKKKPPVCDENTKFRSVDGTCNNLDNPLWGSANQPFIRLIAPDYGDGIGSPRKQQDGSKLPNARKVSRVFTEQDNPSTSLTLLSMLWGQLLDHDITLGAHSDEDCEGRCAEAGTDCFGIPVPQDDPVFVARNLACITMTRDAAAVHPNCKLGPREQLNVLTAYIDASMVYGADKITAARERDLDSDLGLMKETPNPNGINFLPLLPQVDDPNCDPDNDDDKCFSSGDVRVNENPGLMSMQTLWIREHNRIARRLKELKPCLSGEDIYQIARKIVGAEIQHITFNEYLPHILDENTRQNNKLILQTSGYNSGYDIAVDATVINSFAAAAYRFGHSMIQNNFKRYGPTPQNLPHDDIELKEHFGNPTPLYDVCNGGVDAIYRGLLKSPAQSVDGFFAKAIQENLVRDALDVAGSDLIALNIQRGREHGLPGYNAFRKACGLSTFATFDEFKKALPLNIVTAIEKLYKHPDDVDLWVGGISEIKNDPVNDAMGPTFSCIIGKQFGTLRAGDRFWYETDDPVTRFTPDQLSEIRKVTLAAVICKNSDSIRQITKEVFHVGSNGVACADLPQMDLRKWTDGVDMSAGEHVGA